MPLPIRDRRHLAQAEVIPEGGSDSSTEWQAEKRLRRLDRSLLTWQAALWAGGSLVLLLGALALVVFTGSPPTETATLSPVTATDITYGPEGARVVVVEYADFQCESCARFAPMLASLRSKYGDQVQFVFRFFPLAYHKYGMLSSETAYAAFLQGKFWEMHDLLYERQKEWAGAADAYPYFESYANSLGLDMSRFRNDVNAQTTKDFITKQEAAGTEAGVSHTPWFAVNGTTLVPNDIGDFEALIDAGL
ncbi:MAG: thioredoxin domain-containing protein [Actinobacteria bacterium]|nr:thioredoxin domain-containing protein [Actinomycetota bacterium]